MSIKTMDVSLIEATIERKQTAGRLMQLYLHDFSEFIDIDVDETGLFPDPFFDRYWGEPDRYPFLIYVDDKVAGLALVCKHSIVCESGTAWSIAEFFVMRKYRRRSVGTRAAVGLFDRFPGQWEVRQVQANVASQRFWRKVIEEYTGGRYCETFLETPAWHGPVQTFVSGPVR